MAPVLKKALARNEYWFLKAKLTKEDLILVRSSKGLDKTSYALGDLAPHETPPGVAPSIWRTVKKSSGGRRHKWDTTRPGFGRNLEYDPAVNEADRLRFNRNVE